MSNKTKQVWYVFACELDGPANDAVMWDNGKEKLGDRWYGPKIHAKPYSLYGDAWNSMQEAYAANKGRLHKRTFGIVEGTAYYIDGDQIKPTERASNYVFPYDIPMSKMEDRPKVNKEDETVEDGNYWDEDIPED